MPKITFIGAGSWVFTRNLVRDVLTFDRMKDATICLMDIDPEKLEFARRAAQRFIDAGKYPARVITTLNRQQALEGSDAVLCTILSGDVEIWRHDIEIPTRYGVDTNIGDTRGPSGIFRALRTIPVMIEIARDIERLCPDAILLNYTNPMAMLCRAIQRETTVKVTGLCHSVQGTAEMLARWIGAPMAEVDYTCAGINHMAFYTRFLWKGNDAYPLIRQAIETPEIYKEEIVRNEMFKALDYYVTESSGHNSEYNWWFRKRPELIAKYCNPGTGWNPGESMYGLKHRLKRQHDWKLEVEKWFKDPATLKLQRGHEYAAYIINAVLGGEPFEFNGNVPNTGLITNLPYNACVEVPVLANRRGFNPMHVGALPSQLVPLVGLTVAIEELAVEAALTGNARLVYQAICHDPLTAARLSLDEIKCMTQELFAASAGYLPTFKNTSI